MLGTFQGTLGIMQLELDAAAGAIQLFYVGAFYRPSIYIPLIQLTSAVYGSENPNYLTDPRGMVATLVPVSSELSQARWWEGDDFIH